MSRISDAFKRMSGTPAGRPGGNPDTQLALDHYARERGGIRPDDPPPFSRISSQRPIAAPPGHTAVFPAPAAPGAVTPIATAAHESDAERLIDVEQLGNYVGFVFRAVLRRKVMAATIFLLMAALAITAALVWPKSYLVNARLLVQRNDIMASLVNPGRTISREAEAPTRAAEEIVLQHDNLLSLIKQTDLLAEWERTRAPLLKVKDRLFEQVRGPMTDDERLDAMVGLLEQRLRISTTTEGTVDFDLRWPDGRLANDIVEKAIQNFLQIRKVGETSAIADSIAILDRSVQTLEAQVNQTISELPKRRTAPVRRTIPAPAPAQPTAIPVARRTGPPPEIAARLAKLKAAIDARQEEIARLEGLRRQQLSEAQSRLSAATTIYTDGHPTIVALRQSLAQLSREAPEVTSLRREVQSLEGERDGLTTVIENDAQASESERLAAIQAATSAAPAAPRTEAVSPGIDFTSITGATEVNDPTSLRLKVELAELATVRERANAARAEMSSSQAGFKYQYNVIRPPRIPRGPSSPNVPAVIAAGLIASLMLAMMAAVAADLASGRILEPWQVERQVGVPVALRLQEQ